MIRPRQNKLKPKENNNSKQIKINARTVHSFQTFLRFWPLGANPSLGAHNINVSYKKHF